MGRGRKDDCWSETTFFLHFGIVTAVLLLVCAVGSSQGICPTNALSQECSNEGFCNGTACICNSTRIGSFCQIECPLFSNDTDACRAQGACVEDAEGLGAAECSCYEGFRGTFCEYVCPRNPSTNAVCSNLGVCDDLGDCLCSEGHVFGQACQYVCPRDETRNNATCGGSARGTCDASTLGLCECNPGFKGDKCQYTCPRSSETNQICSGSQQGECNDFGICECKVGYNGTSCENTCPFTTSPEGAKLVCTDRGFCDMGGECQCDYGYIGDKCHVIPVWSKYHSVFDFPTSSETAQMYEEPLYWLAAIPCGIFILALGLTLLSNRIARKRAQRKRDEEEIQAEVKELVGPGP